MERVDRNGAAAVPEGACTVGQLNEETERALADAGDRFPGHVVGEIAEVDDYGFGTFFELRDPETDPSILVQRENPALPVRDACSDRPSRNQGANRAGVNRVSSGGGHHYFA